jgi:hypothetical protein
MRTDKVLWTSSGLAFDFLLMHVRLPRERACAAVVELSKRL